jgi:hypothetical protein
VSLGRLSLTYVYFWPQAKRPLKGGEVESKLARETGS